MTYSLYSIKSSLYRIRKNRVPPFPQSEICFEGEWAKTHTGYQFLMTEDGDRSDKIIIFSTSDNLRKLSESENLCGWNFSDVSLALLSNIYAALHEVREAIPMCLLSSSWKIPEYLFVSVCLSLSNKDLKTLDT